MDGKVGIGKLAIYGREYVVAVRQHKYLRGALILQTLHHAAEIRSIDALDELHALPPRVKVEEVALARQVIAAFTRPLNQVEFRDEYRADTQRLIDAKVNGQEIVVPPVATPTYMDYRDALVMSLQAMKTTPAKATPAKRKKAS
jgi:DNA end-binding protein Ku